MNPNVGSQGPNPSISADPAYSNPGQAPKESPEGVSTPSGLRGRPTTVQSGTATLPGQNGIVATNHTNASIAQKAAGVISHSPDQKPADLLASHNVIHQNPQTDPAQHVDAVGQAAIPARGVEPEGLSGALDVDFNDIVVDLPEGFFVADPDTSAAGLPKAQQYSDGTRVLDLSGAGATLDAGLVSNLGCFEDIAQVDGKSIDFLYSPATGMIATTLSRPITAGDLAAFKAVQAAYHKANPHVPIKPLVVVVLNQNAWAQFTSSLERISTEKEASSKQEKAAPTVTKKHETKLDASPVRGADVRDKRQVERDEKTVTVGPVDGPAKEKVLQKFEEAARAEDEERKQSRKKDEIEKEKLEQEIKSYAQKLEQRESGAKRGNTSG